MPELPEVETVRQTLRKNILNRTIVDLKIYYEKMIRNTSIDEFRKNLIGQEFIEISRRGKYLIFILNEFILVSHLRMEGKYNLMNDEVISKHEHVIFELDNQTSLRYHDVRKFGTMDLFPKMELSKLYLINPLIRVANDPLDQNFDSLAVIKRFKNSKKPIKTALLDQSIMSGIGNIYADEILFTSGVHPLVFANSLSEEKLQEIIENSVLILNKAISLGGTTIKSFTSSHSISGRFQNELLVHTKEICPTCGLKISKIKVGGRTSYFCEECQKTIDKIT